MGRYSGRTEMWVRLYRREALAEQGGRCAYCAEPLRPSEATADHKHPHSKGGAVSKKNIVAACHPCNQAKGDLSHNQFMNFIRGQEVPSGSPVHMMRAWMRRRIALRADRACRRILKSVGAAA